MALAAATGGRLVSLYAGTERAGLAPKAAELASRWNVRVEHELRRIPEEDDPADAVAAAMRALAPALVVVGTHARHGIAAVVHASVGEAIARNFDAPVLVVPNDCRGFVDPLTGSIELARVVIPAGDRAEATRSVEAIRSLVAMLGIRPPELALLHAGADGAALATLGLSVIPLDGVLEHAIVAASRTREAAMIAMVTRGHDGVGDVFRGSLTERVIRDARCPVLSIPI